DRLAACACASLQASRVAVVGVVATGGDVAEAFYRKLDSPPLIVDQEAIVGVPVTTVAEGPFAGLRVAAKTGSFGAVEAFAQIVAWLQARQPEAVESWASSIPIVGEEQ